MDLDRPPPGASLRADGEPTVPRPAAAAIVVRGGAVALEVLLVRRTPHASFMADVWVFPGGTVTAADGSGEQAFRGAAARETAEEAGLVLADLAGLVPFGRWITPARMLTRFDTRFYLAELPVGAQVRVDGREVVDHRWLTPPAAVDAYAAGELSLVLPTLRQLQELSGFANVAELLASAGDRDQRPMEPRVVGDGTEARLVLPGEPGYDG